MRYAPRDVRLQRTICRFASEVGIAMIDTLLSGNFMLSGDIKLKGLIQPAYQVNPGSKSNS